MLRYRRARVELALDTRHEEAIRFESNLLAMDAEAFAATGQSSAIPPSRGSGSQQSGHRASRAA